MNIKEARNIFVEYYPNLPLAMKKAIKFTLENWDEMRNIPVTPAPFEFSVDSALAFLNDLPKLPTDARQEDSTFISKLNCAVGTLKTNFSVWLRLEDFPHEEWRDIIGYEGLYQVSNFGRIKSFHKNKVIIRNLVTLTEGYKQVSLDKDGKRKCKNVHELVAKAFLTNPENKPIIDHYDRNTTNNCVWNLSWVTNSENQRRAVELGSKKCGCDNPRSNFTPEQVREIRRLYVRGSHEFSSVALAKKFGVAISTIKRIVNGKSYKNVE